MTSRTHSNLRRSFPGLLALLTMFCLAQSARAQAVGHGVGDFFPDVELPTIDGEQTLRLSSFRGQRLLLIEFASW